MYRDIKRLGYPKDVFQVLCFNCNYSKNSWGYCPHKYQRTTEYPIKLNYPASVNDAGDVETKTLLDKMTRRKQRRSMKWHIIKELGNKCECCDEDKLELLTIDHINKDGAVHRRQKGGDVWRDIVKLGVPKDRFRALCYNCNYALYHNDTCLHHKRVQ